jgi:uncharacterized repeat protein (TIGR02543 family)
LVKKGEKSGKPRRAARGRGAAGSAQAASSLKAVAFVLAALLAASAFHYEAYAERNAGERAYERLSGDMSAEGGPMDEAPEEGAPADESPADEESADEAPADEFPAGEGPADKGPAGESPACRCKVPGSCHCPVPEDEDIPQVDDIPVNKDAPSMSGGAASTGGGASPSGVASPAGIVTKAAWEKCTIKTPQTVQTGTGFIIRLIGDRQDEKGKYDGETKFVPISWEIKGVPFGRYVSGKPFASPYESVVTLKNAGTYTITAKYRAFTYTDGVGWAEDGADFEYSKKAVVAAPLTVRFDARGGKVSAPEGRYFLSETCGAFPVPSRKGYRFTGWYRTKNGEASERVRGNDRVALLNTSKGASVTLYAHYGRAVKVRFDANGGKVKTKNKSVLYVTGYDKKTYGKLPKPVRRGYHFAGWYTKKKGGRYISSYSKVNSAKRLTLYAHWIR